MKRYALPLCGLALAMLTASPLLADTLFNFSFNTGPTSGPNAPPFSGSGQFDTTATATSGQFLITGVTGSVDGYGITALYPVQGYEGNDNLLFYSPGDASAALDYDGVAFQLGTGPNADFYFNTFASTPVDTEELSGVTYAGQEMSPISITPASVSPVPEPGSLLLLGSGVFGLAGALRRKMKV